MAPSVVCGRGTLLGNHVVRYYHVAPDGRDCTSLTLVGCVIVMGAIALLEALRLAAIAIFFQRPIWKRPRLPTDSEFHVRCETFLCVIFI